MARSAWRELSVLLALAPAAALGQVVPAPPAAVVRTVLFFSPTCPHCHKVMSEDLPPLVQRYGGRLRIATVDVTTPGGQALYQATVSHFGLPNERQGVPTLVVGDRVLVGDEEIPDQLPGIVDRALAAGGLGWPPVPEIQAAAARAEAAADARRQAAAPESAHAAPRPAVAPAPARADTTAARPVDSAPARPAGAQGEAVARGPGVAAAPEARVRPAPAAAPPRQPAPAPLVRPQDTVSRAAARGAHDTAVAAGSAATLGTAPPHAQPIALTPSSAPTTRQRFLTDPVGNGAAVAMLALMLLALGLVASTLLGWRVRLPAAPGWLVPILGLVGLGVAAYLAVVEVTGARAVCGPVGDCNTVQQSPYARLFGVLPIGVLGMAGYIGMVGAWTLGALSPGGLARAGTLGAWGMALFGTVFSIYLTFLEPFVIGATCAWCLTSAAVVTLLLLVLTPAARRALQGPGTADAPGTP